MALFIDEDSLRDMLDKFVDDTFGVYNYQTDDTVEELIDKFVEGCKKELDKS